MQELNTRISLLKKSNGQRLETIYFREEIEGLNGECKVGDVIRYKGEDYYIYEVQIVFYSPPENLGDDLPLVDFDIILRVEKNDARFLDSDTLT